MTTKHTPGPWTVHPQFTEGAEVRGIAPVAWCGRAHSMAQGREHSVDFEEACANAHLIAAAPDLLAACEAALACLVFFGTDQLEPFRAQVRAAIAKAKGETP